MATHSTVLAWRIPGTEKPGGLPSMGSHRVGHDMRLSSSSSSSSREGDGKPLQLFLSREPHEQHEKAKQI